MPRTEAANEIIREQRKTEILFAAAKVFARKGFTDTKIADMAVAVEMSQGLLYRYFASKEEVFATLLERSIIWYADLVRQALEQAGTAWDKLYWLTNQLLPSYYQQPEFPMLVLHALTNETVPEKIRHSLTDHVQTIQKMLCQLIAEGQAAKLINQRNSVQLTVLYLATLNGLAAAVAFSGYSPANFPDAAALMQMFKP